MGVLAMGNKTILLSVKPEHVANILNGLKTIEIRKTCPKEELPITVYIYCTKDIKNIYRVMRNYNNKVLKLVASSNAFKEELKDRNTINGKVVAKFTLNKVEKIKYHCLTRYNSYGISKIVNEYNTKSLTYSQLRKAACLTDDKMDNYFSGALVVDGIVGYAWHIDDLIIFDKTKELSRFGTLTNKCNGFRGGLKPLTKAPQSWCYIEAD